MTRRIYAILFLISAATAGLAQTDAKSAKPFSVPCARALSVGTEKLEALHEAERRRRLKGATDSGTETAATVAALKNYISCRRAKTAAELKTFIARDAIAEVKRLETSAKNLAKMRFDRLIYGVAWDETGADSINYPMTLRAVALVEDFKGKIVGVYAQDVSPDESERVAEAQRDKKTTGEILARMENRRFEDAADAEDYKAKLAKFKTAINKFLADNADHAPVEEAAAADFVVKLLNLGLAE